MPEKNREEVLNVHLARLLKQRGIDARPERRSRGNAPISGSNSSAANAP